MSHILRSGAEYNPTAYKGGHRVYCCQFATVLSYCSADGYRFIVEFYDDHSRLFAIKKSQVNYATEEAALAAGQRLVNWYDRESA